MISNYPFHLPIRCHQNQIITSFMQINLKLLPPELTRQKNRSTLQKVIVTRTFNKQMTIQIQRKPLSRYNKPACVRTSKWRVLVSLSRKFNKFIITCPYPTYLQITFKSTTNILNLVTIHTNPTSLPLIRRGLRSLSANYQKKKRKA